jgi:hypothetical protein
MEYATKFLKTVLSLRVFLLRMHAVSIIEVCEKKQDLCLIEIVNWFLNVNRIR